MPHKQGHPKARSQGQPDFWESKQGDGSASGVPPGHKIDPQTGKIIQRGVGKEYKP
jgi:hypothetical protein